MAFDDTNTMTRSPFPTMQPGDHLGPQFGEMASAGIGVFGSPGLANTQAQSQSRVPRTVTPSTSGNGMSSGQYQATLAGQFPTNNGMAENQYEISKFSMKKD